MQSNRQHQIGGSVFSCREFLEGHAEYVDGALPEALADPFENHVQVCGECQHFDSVVRRGLMLARSLPDIQPSEHFHERLQARLMRLENEPLEKPMVAGSATLVMIAAVLGLIALTPILGIPDPEPTESAQERQALPVGAFGVAPFGIAIPSSDPMPHITTAVLIHTLEPSTFSPVVVSPPAVQTTRLAPRLISYPLLQLPAQ